MSLVRTTAILLTLSGALCAQDPSVWSAKHLESARAWVREDAEQWVFDVAGLDRTQLEDWLLAAQRALAEPAPAEIEPSRENAEQLVSGLSTVEELQPYALWLQSLLTEADRRRPPAETNTLHSTQGRPTPLELRARWLSRLQHRPLPAGARRHVGPVKQIFRAEGVPTELVWVAEVESAFDDEARSPVGAVGLFQLMPDTAESLGLSTWFPDERGNADKNARAAAHYLRYLRDRFGQWQLALAAYNAGPTRVARLLRKSSDYSYEAIVQDLPAETRDYVAKVEATLLLREGIELLSLPASIR